MIKINPNLFPKDGYFYKESDGSVHRAQSWAGVIARVVSYRRRNKLPMGNVAVDVTAQACTRNPAFCHEETEGQVRQRAVVSLKGRVLQWLSALRKRKSQQPLTFVSAAEAVSRANVCARCPNNIALAEGCSSCRAALKESRNVVLGPGRATDARLNGCLITGADLPTDVHLDNIRVQSTALPPHCWRKAI